MDVGASGGPFLVVATDGSFVDEATGAIIKLNADELTALVPSFMPGGKLDRLLVTPVSHFAAAFALRVLRTEGVSLQSAHEEAWLHLNAHFGALDWRITEPADLTTSTSSQLDAAGRAGLILAALSQESATIAEETGMTPGGNVNPMSLTQALYEDLGSDGYFDGKGDGGRQLLLPPDAVFQTYALDGQTLRYALASAAMKYLSNPRNTYRITEADVQPLARDISRGSSPRLFREPGSDYDTLPPVVSVRVRYKAGNGAFVEAPGATPHARGLLQLEVDATDDSGVRSMNVTHQGATLTPAASGNTVSHFVGTWDATLTADGPLVFTVASEDERGNRGGEELHRRS